MRVGVWCVCVCVSACECLRVCMGVWVRVRVWVRVWVFMLAVTYLTQPSSVLTKVKIIMGGDLLHLDITVPIVDGGSLHAI